MCLAVPGIIESIDGDHGMADFMGNRQEVNLALVDEAVVGDYVLVHAGFAIEKISQDEAAETIKLFEELDESNTKA